MKKLLYKDWDIVKEAIITDLLASNIQDRYDKKLSWRLEIDWIWNSTHIPFDFIWIKEYTEPKKLDDWAWFFCDFGTFHKFNEKKWWKCWCEKLAWCNNIVFQNRMRDLWFDIVYNSDITKEMIKKYKEVYFNN